MPTWILEIILKERIETEISNENISYNYLSSIYSSYREKKKEMTKTKKINGKNDKKRMKRKIVVVIINSSRDISQRK